MKQAKKMVSIVLIIMLALNITMTSTLAEDGAAVTPGPEDYAFSNGIITGLKAEYLAGLSDEEKLNIRLEIPGEINGVIVTGIGDSAFKPSNKNVGCNFTSLDLSKTTALKTIGNYAFQDIKTLRGGITLPDTVISLGTQVFYGCTGLDGNLVLPDNLTSIPLNAFYGCNFTGTLTLPSNLETIAGSAFRKNDNMQEGFTGKIIFPASIKSIGSSAFLNQSGITEIEFKGDQLFEIKGSAFKDTALSGVLELPENIKTLGSYFIQGTTIEYVYLPKMDTIDFGSNTFDYASIQAVICSAEDYQTIYSKLSTAGKGVLTYPLTVAFDDGKEGTYEPRNCLYNFPYNLEQQEDKTWLANASYQFPKIIGSDNMVWAKSKTSMIAVKTTDKVGGATLYAVEKIENPVITYSSGIDKVYDGKDSILSVTATHPAAVKSTQIKAVGEVLFNYTWKWGTIGSSQPVLSGWDKNQYGVADYRVPYTIHCNVTVSAYVVTKIENGSASVTKFYTESHDFPVDIRQATPNLSKIPQGIIKTQEGTTALPNLPTVDGGALTWDVGQTLKSGFNSYAWTFTPDPNGVGSTNYKPMKGKALICPATETPTTESVNDQIEKLPQITEGTVVNETVQNSILDAFITVESVGQDIKDEISEAKKDKIYDAIAKLPNVTTKAPEESKITTTDLDNLLRNLTAEEALLLKDQNVKLAIDIKAEEAVPTENDLQVIESAVPDMKIGTSFEINIEKTIGETKGNISELNKPITLTFDVPAELKGAKDLSLIRIHTNADGRKQAETLEDKDTNPNTITISSDKFSLFAIAYKEKADEPSGGGTVAPKQYEIKASASAGGKISPEGTVNVYGGFSQSFEITSDAGYHISKVTVDGKNIGTPKAYTFDDVWGNHHITVEFAKNPPSKSEIIKGVRATTIKAKSSAKKGSVLITWVKSKGYKVNYYQVFRSKKKTSSYGTKAFYTTKYGTTKSYKNTKSLRKGTRYYYKVRGVRILDGKKYYTKWSTLAYRIAK